MQLVALPDQCAATSSCMLELNRTPNKPSFHVKNGAFQSVNLRIRIRTVSISMLLYTLVHSYTNIAGKSIAVFSPHVGVSRDLQDDRTKGREIGIRGGYYKTHSMVITQE